MTRRRFSVPYCLPPLLITAVILAAPIPWTLPRQPLVVEAKSSQFIDAVRNLRDGQTLRLVGGGDVPIPQFLTLENRRNIRIIATEPVTLTGGQLGFVNCEGVTLENLRLYPLEGRSQRQIAAYIERYDGREGRALVLMGCRDVTVRNCTFACCGDDMAGASGDSAAILYDRCLFTMPLGIERKGLLVWHSRGAIVHIPDRLTLRDCVFVGVDYRTPKLEGGFYRVLRCIIADQHWPIELKEPDVQFSGCWFWPNPNMRVRPIAFTTASFGLHLEGNRLSGRPAGWSDLVGLPGRGSLDAKNVIARGPLDADAPAPADESADPVSPSPPTMEDVLSAAGTRGPPDEIESAARWYVRLMAR